MVDQRLRNLVRDALSTSEATWLTYEIVRHLPYWDALAVSRLNKTVWRVCRTSKQIRAVMEKWRMLVQHQTRIYMRNFGRELLFEVSARGQVEIVDELIGRGWDPSVDRAIEIASRNGHLRVVDRLLWDRRVDPSQNDNYAIRCASQNGHLQVVKRLLRDSRVDPSADDNFAIKAAVTRGYEAIAQCLLVDKRVRATYRPTI